MKIRRFSTYRLHGVLLYSLLIAGLLMQSLVPMGYMPSLKSDRFYNIEICSSSGLVTIAVPDHDGGKAPSTNHASEQPALCPFALAVSGLSPVVIDLLRAPLVVSQLILSGEHFMPPQIALKPWFAQGPP